MMQALMNRTDTNAEIKLVQESELLIIKPFMSLFIIKLRVQVDCINMIIMNI